MNTQLVVLAR